MSKALFDELLKEVDTRIAKALNKWRPNLAHSTGAIPGQQLPITGNTGSGYTPVDHQADHQAGGGDALSGNLDATARVGVRKNSTGSVFSRRRLNLIEGTGATITVADDSGNEEVDITIAAATGTVIVEEVDGSPTDSAVTKIVFPNGTLGIASHVATYTPTSPSAPDYVLIVDSQTTGTDGGTFTNGAWRTRVLNTEKVDTGSHASISSNQVTLAAGTWRVRANAPGYNCGRHQARLYDITNTAVLLSGTSEHTAAFAETRSHVVGRITLSGSTVLELQHQCETSSATFGLGVASGSAFTVGEEIYAMIEFTKE